MEGEPYREIVPCEVVVEPPAAAPPLVSVPAPRPWGFWMTVLWSLLVAGVFLVAQTVVGVAFVIPAMSDGVLDAAELTGLESNGLLLSLGTLASAPAVVGLVWPICALRGWRPMEYLALRNVPPARWVAWMVAGGLLMASLDVLTWLIGRDIVPHVMVEAYRTAGFVPLLLLALVVAAPVSEEVFFRGFLFRGLASSRLGNAATVLATATVFAVIHLQYDWYGMVTVFVGGVFLGLARWQTGSAALTIALHALQNLVATAEMAIVAAQSR